jgi:acyl dehydratase
MHEDLPAAGDRATYTRTFTHDDVRQFVDVSNDEGEHHLEPDDEGRLLVHGLLTATLPTKLGGDLDVLARTMEFEFTRPVYTGETVTCEAVFETVEPRENGDAEVRAAFECTKAGETVVMRGTFEGVIRG